MSCMLHTMTMRTIEDDGAYLRPGEAATLLKVHPKTLTRMAERNDVQSITLPSGHRRYLRTDIESLTEQPP